MLGRSANGVYWMARNLERAENTARLLDVGFRLALNSGERDASDEEWRSVLVTTGQLNAYNAHFDELTGPNVFNFILRDKDNPASVLKMIESARTNARMVRTCITSEVWEATNESWMHLCDIMARPVRETNLGEVLTAVTRQTTQVTGAIEGTMLRDEVFNFSRIGTFMERADNTARILDFKYYVLLPSAAWVGSRLDNAQWDTLLRSLAGRRAYRSLSKGQMDARGISSLLVLDDRFPRSLAFCYARIRDNLDNLARQYGNEAEAQEMLHSAETQLSGTTIEDIFDAGLHEFLLDFIGQISRIGEVISAQYRFVE